MTAWPEGYGRVLRDEVTSTLDVVRDVARDQSGPFWLLAHRQTAARGRRGRAWQMPSGNFAATLVLRLNEPPARIALRSFVMSLALQRAFAEVTGAPGAFELKWPNDVLLNGGKVAGILLESAVPGMLSIGVGVNLVAAPDVADVEEGAVTPVALAAETGVNCAAEDFLQILAHHFAKVEKQFQTLDFEPIRAGWLAHAARLGETITARTGSDSVTGIFEDVDAAGHLVVRGPRGVTTIAAADIYF